MDDYQIREEKRKKKRRRKEERRREEERRRRRREDNYYYNRGYDDGYNDGYDDGFDDNTVELSEFKRGNISITTSEPIDINSLIAIADELQEKYGVEEELDFNINITHDSNLPEGITSIDEVAVTDENNKE